MGWLIHLCGRRFPQTILIAAVVIGNARFCAAEEEFLASVRLRGGYDSNPTLNLGAARGTAFIGTDAAFVAAKGNDQYAGGVIGEATYTHFQHDEIDPQQRYRLAYNLSNKVEDGVAIRSEGSALAFRNYDTQLNDFEQKLRLRKVGGEWQPFLRAELRYTSLNEKNVILGEFLPEPQKFLRGTIIPGIAWKKEKFEVGASLGMSATRYDDRLDYFGFRRDNERIQPFIFAEYSDGKLSVFAAASQLYGDWHDADFTDVRKTLFHFNVDYRHETYLLELAAVRVATDTTFPLSPISIDTTYSAKISRDIDDKTVAALFGRKVEREFLDSPFRSQTEAIGLEMSREIGSETVIGLEIAQLRATPIIGSAVNGTVGFISVMKRTSADPERKLRAGRTIPAR